MFRILIVVTILTGPYLWDHALHATGVKKGLWIIGALAIVCCAAIVMVYVVRILRSQKINSHRADGVPAAVDSSICVGVDLANAVADALDAGHSLANGHAYYCGMGLTKYDENYVYASVHDGEIVTPKWGEAFYREVESEQAKLFTSRADFIEWLSVQTNHSLHGDGNQRITLERLRFFGSLVGRE